MNLEKFLFITNVIVTRAINSINSLFYSEKKRNTIQSILIIKYDEIGDVVNMLHLPELLHHQFPTANIDIIVKPYCKELLKANPHIHQIYTTTTAYQKRYDICIDLRGNWSSLIRSILFWPKYKADRGTVRLKNRGRQPHETKTNLEILELIFPVDKSITQNRTIYFSDASKDKVDEFLKHNSVNEFAVFHVSARRTLRQWPIENFAYIADYLIEHYNLKIIFCGSKSEENQIYSCTNKMHYANQAILFTHFSLSELAYLMDKAKFFLGNESGPLQIADAMGCKAIALFGPGVPVVFYPLHPNSHVIHYIFHCNPCNQIDCVQWPEPCIQKITVAEVTATVNKILKEG